MIRVLSVDDELDMGIILPVFFGRAGYNLWFTRDSYEAWALLHTLSFDLLIQNIMKCDVNGLEFFRRVRADERLKDIPVVFFSDAAYLVEQMISDGSVDIEGYVPKIDTRGLIAAVRKAMEQRGKPVPPERKRREMEPDECLATLHAPDSQERRIALAFWGCGKCENGWPVEPVIQALKDTEGAVRLAAVKTLKRFKERRAVEPITALLKDQELEVRLAAVQALGELGDKRAVKPLIEHLRGPDSATRWAVVLALGRLKARQAIIPLFAVLNDEDALVRFMAARSLGRVGPRWTVALALSKPRRPITLPGLIDASGSSRCGS